MEECVEARVGADFVESRVYAREGEADGVFVRREREPRESLVALAEQRVDDGKLVGRYRFLVAPRDKAAKVSRASSARPQEA